MARFTAVEINLDAETPTDVVNRTDADGALSEEQKSFVDKANDLAIKLQSDQAADKRRKLADELLKSRAATRTEIADALTVTVAQFINDETKPRVDSIDEIRARYEAKLRKFVARPAPADELHYSGHFEILESNETLSAAETAAVKQVRAAVAELAEDDVRDREKESGLSSAAVEARVLLRTKAAKDYRAFIDDDQAATGDIAKEVALRRGRYQALRDRIKEKLFRVIDTAQQSKTAAVETSDEEYPELRMLLKSGLPEPEDIPSPEKLELYVQLYKTNAVMRAVYYRARERPVRKWWVPKWLHERYARLMEPSKKAAQDQAQRLHKEFLSKLNDIAVVGLEMNFPQLAKLTLDELRIEYFMLQAERIKKQHAKTLGRVAVSLSTLLIICYGIICWKERPGGQGTWDFFFMDHKNFLLAAAGAAIATWASFVARQVAFKFDDLVMLDENSVPASLRVTFVIILTMAACLFFWTGAVNIEIGDLKTKANFFKSSGTIALLIGLLCGFSERALAQAITGRSAAFVKTVGGA